MDEEHLRNEELEVQYFDFTSEQFIAEFKKLVRDTVRDTLNALEKKLLEYGVNDEDAVKEEIKRLFEEYMAVRDEVMLVAEEEIKKFLSIPKAAIRHLDWSQNYAVSADESITDLEMEVKKLEEEYIKEQTFQLLCKAELKKLEVLDPIFEKMRIILSKKLNVKDKPISTKTEKLLKIYDEVISNMNEDSPDIIQSICRNYNQCA